MSARDDYPAGDSVSVKGIWIERGTYVRAMDEIDRLRSVIRRYSEMVTELKSTSCRGCGDYHTTNGVPLAVSPDCPLHGHLVWQPAEAK